MQMKLFEMNVYLIMFIEFVLTLIWVK